MNRRDKNIVIMGGSFNPPTLAHYMLMKCAIDAVNAECGYFVPVSDAYLRRKMRHSHPPVVLSPDLRIKMLQAMCTTNRMQVCDKEIGSIEPRTLPTLKSFKSEFPEYELYFVMGDDKLNLLSGLTEKGAFFDTSNVILFSRNSDSIEETLKNHGVLSGYMDNIVVLPQPQGIAGISSSVIREHMLKGESCPEMLVPGVLEIFGNFNPDDFPDVINKFKGEYDFLSNRYSSPFIWKGVKYPSAEAAYNASDPADNNLEIMTSVLEEKFRQNPKLMQKLIDTGNKILNNGNNKHETYWGIDLYSWIGENHLGKILMSIRDKEKNNEIQY